jgi:bleomycin hydrolase
MKKIIAFAVLLASIFSTQAQNLTNRPGSNYKFTSVADVEATAVEDQERTNTCWSFSTISFIESELIRMGKGRHDLSEMFIVRYTYMQKAEKYIRMHGHINFAEGGAFHDVTAVIKEYGIVPESIYGGKQYRGNKHNHAELEKILKGMLDGLIKSKAPLKNTWKDAVAGILDAYLGKLPTEFEYQGKTYTANTFAESMGLDMDNYVELTSFTHHPFYETFALEVPDNWRYGHVYNLPLDEFVAATDNSLEKGYSIGWGSDVSESGFSHRNALAIVPKADMKYMGREEKDALFESPTDELEINQELRQEGFDNYLTQDDHAMQLTGIVKDQNGTKYYKVKNSWGESNACGGYFYASEAFYKYKTISIMVHKGAIPKAIRSKLKI